MVRRFTLCALTTLATLVATGSECVAQNVVGMRQEFTSLSVGVRGIVPAGTSVSGVRFYSNDASTFPEIMLVADTAERRLPTRSVVLRTASDVQGAAGYVTVSFEPYEVTADQYLWVLIRFPNGDRIISRGVGGGAGIGYRSERGLLRERSFFFVDGAINEFMPESFDISLVTTRQMSATKPAAKANIGIPAQVSARMQSEGVTFHFSLPTDAQVSLDVFDVAGRRVATVLNRPLTAGQHDIPWRPESDQGSRLGSGIYLYRAQLGEEVFRGKVVVIR